MVYVTSFHNGNRLTDSQANSIKDIVIELGISLDGVTISVNGDEASLETPIRDGDVVSFARHNVKSGGR